MRYFEWLLKWLIPIFFLYDLLAKILWFSELTKGLYFLACVFKITLIIVLLNWGRKELLVNKKIIFISIGLTITYLLNQISLFNEIEMDNILFNGYYFLSSIAGLILLSFIFHYNNSSVLERVMINFSYLITINSIIIFIGLIYEISFLETYSVSGKRFGFKGFLSYHSEVGYIYLIGLNVLYFIFKKTKNRTYLVLLLINFIAVFITGTKKAILLGALFLILFLVDNRHVIFRKPIRETGLIALFLLVLLSFIINPLKKVFWFFYEVYNDHGITSSFFSYRNILLKEEFLPYIKKKWTFINYIIGGPSFSDYRIEMEFFDIYLFFGLLGMVGYITLLIMFLKRSKSLILSYTTYALILAALFSGNLLSSINVMVLYSFMFLYIVNNQKVIS